METLHLLVSLWLWPYHLTERFHFRFRCWWRGLDYADVEPVLRLYQRRQVILAELQLCHWARPGGELGPLYAECKRKNARARKVLDLV
jgi:hypothetical protein